MKQSAAEMYRREALFVDRAPADLLLRTDAGEPVWPAFTPDQHALLAELCERCQASLVEVEGKAGPVQPEHGEVVFFPEDLAPAARLYGHLTRRRVRPLEDMSSLSGAAVLLTRHDALDHRLLAALYRQAAGDEYPGIVCIDDEASFHDVLYYAATAHLTGPPADRACYFSPQVSCEVVEQGKAVIVGGNASKEAILDVLRDDGGLKVVITHSDGIDAFCGPRLSVCGVRDRLGTSVGPLPRCVESGHCHRYGMSVDEALGDDRLLSPAEVRSWLLLWGVCWGVVLEPSVVSPHWSITRQLLAARAAPAILTTWTVEVITPEPFARLASDALRGVPIGKALRRLSSTTSWRKNQLGLCLLGDPRARLGSPSGEPPASLRAGEPRRRTMAIGASPPRPRRNDKVEFLQNLVHGVTHLRDVEDQAAKAFLSCAAEFDPSAGGPQAREWTEKLQARLLSYISLSGLLMVNRWLAGSKYRAARSRAPSPCPWCLPEIREVRRFTAEVHGLKRRFSICPVCGVIEDVPAGSTLKASLDRDARFRLRGIPRVSPWSGVIVISPQVSSEGLATPWPRGRDQRPLREAEVGGRWPIGPLDVGVVFMFGLDLYILARRARRSPLIDSSERTLRSLRHLARGREQD